MGITSRSNNNNSSLSTLDRTLTIILENPDATGSRRDGITPEVERLHRWHGTSLLWQVSILLNLGPSCYVTASTLFHRFYHQCSLRDYDVWSIAMACNLLATKLEERPKTLHEIIMVFAKVYSQRLILADLPDDVVMSGDLRTGIEVAALRMGGLQNVVHNLGVGSINGHQELDFSMRKNRRAFCNRVNVQPIHAHTSKATSPSYQEWYQTIRHHESMVLRRLGFTIYWIPDSHPHKFLLYFCQVLEWGNQTHKALVQAAWNYCNDASRIDLCLRYPAETIACAAIWMTARQYDVNLPSSPVPWWQVFLGSEEEQNHHGEPALVNVANTLEGIVQLHNPKQYKTNCVKEHTHHRDTIRDWHIASYGFVRSLKTRTEDQETSFNDPNSFLWEYQKELFEKEILKSTDRTSGAVWDNNHL